MNVSPARSAGDSVARAGQPVAARQHDDAPLHDQRHELEVRLVEREVEEGEVGVALAQARDRVREVERADLDPDVGMAAAEARQHRREQAARRRAERADDQRAGLAAGERPAARERLVGGQQDVLRVGEQRLARGRQLDAAGAAREQGAADLALERADLRRQRRLRQAEPHGSPREVQFLRDGHEVAQLAEVHGSQLIA